MVVSPHFCHVSPTNNYMFNEASLSEMYTNDLHTSKLIISYIIQAHAYGHKRKSGGAGFDIILRLYLM